MIENCISMECLKELKQEYARLRRLVSELLLKNQELRDQLAAKATDIRSILATESGQKL